MSCRCCRQTITGIVTALLVAVGLAIMIVAQSYSKLLQSAIPDLTMCTVRRRSWLPVCCYCWGIVPWLHHCVDAVATHYPLTRLPLHRSLYY